jgi:hypothetical protein
MVIAILNLKFSHEIGKLELTEIYEASAQYQELDLMTSSDIIQIHSETVVK